MKVVTIILKMKVKVIMKLTMKVIMKVIIRVKKDKYYYEIRQWNNWFETIDQTKSLEEQIELLKEKGEFLSEYWYVGYYHGDKELNYKIFKAKAAHLLIDLDEQLFKKLFGHTFVELVEN